MTRGFGDLFKEMPPKQDGDPDNLSIARLSEHMITISVGMQHMTISEHSAARLCGQLALWLGLRFIPSQAKKLLL